MVAYLGVNHTLAYSTTPSAKFGLGEMGGRVRVLFDSFTVTAALLTTDTLQMGKIPKGARVLDFVINSPDLGGTGTMNIGWAAGAGAVEAANATGFYSALDISGQAVVASLSETASAAGLHKKFTEEVPVQLVPAANFSATSGTLSIAVYYVID